MEDGQAPAALRPRIARVKGPSLRTKIVILVVLSALAPAALIGFASYVTAQKIQAEEVASRLGQQAAAAERQTALFMELRAADARAFARSSELRHNLESLAAGRQASDHEAQALARSQTDAFLLEIQEHDSGYEGLAVFDVEGEFVSSTGPSSGWSPTSATSPSAPPGAGLVLGPDSRTLLYLTTEIQDATRNPLGHLLTVISAERLWLRLASAHAESAARLRVLDSRRHPFFDTATYPELPTSPLSATAADLILEVRLGHTTYADERGVEVVATHRFETTHNFGTLVELPKAEALATSRRFRDFALKGSLVTVALIAFVGSILALHVTGPVRKLREGVERATQGDLAQRLEVTSTDEIGYLTVAMNQMFDALEKSRSQLEVMSSTDDLTGLYNRRHLTKMFEVETARTARTGRPLSVLMIDLDHFKAFNDHFGHPQGDAFLRHVASFLKTWLRTTDVLARYGGEEFTVLLPDTDLETASEIAERLRSRFAESQALAGGGEISVTMSIGVSAWEGDSTLGESLIEAADKALYEAKRGGRNRVRVAA